VTEYFLKKSTISIFDTTLRTSSIAEVPGIQTDGGGEERVLIIILNLLQDADLSGKPWNRLPLSVPRTNKSIPQPTLPMEHLHNLKKYGKEKFENYRKWLTEELGVSNHRPSFADPHHRRSLFAKLLQPCILHGSRRFYLSRSFPAALSVSDLGEDFQPAPELFV